MLIMLVISGVIFGAWLLLFKENDPSHIQVEEEWLVENIWRVESYLKMDDGRYDVYLLEVQSPVETTFEDLERTFLNTPYTSFNSESLQDGVNCQGMTVYLANWCEANRVEYSVSWTKTHTFTFIREDDGWYKFDFDISGSTIEPVEPQNVQKGMVSSDRKSVV